VLFNFKSATNADLIIHEKSGKKILAPFGKSPEDALECAANPGEPVIRGV